VDFFFLNLMASISEKETVSARNALTARNFLLFSRHILDICQQSRKSCFIFENNCGKVLVVSEKCVPLHPLSPFRGRQPSKRDH